MELNVAPANTGSSNTQPQAMSKASLLGANQPSSVPETIVANGIKKLAWGNMCSYRLNRCWTCHGVKCSGCHSTSGNVTSAKPEHCIDDGLDHFPPASLSDEMRQHRENQQPKYTTPRHGDAEKQ
ncbi:MAG: hypothetical protein R3F40_13390 [Candidatus Competibacteraceae bacterium]